MSLYNKLNRWEPGSRWAEFAFAAPQENGQKVAPNLLFDSSNSDLLWANIDPSTAEGAEVMYYVWTVFVAAVPAAMLPREQVAAYALPLPFFPHGAAEDLCLMSKCITLSSGNG